MESLVRQVAAVVKIGIVYPSVYQILRVRKLAVVEVHVPLRGRDIGVAQQPAGVFDSLLSADSRPAFMAGQVQHQISRQTGQVP
jgi:hypothetical protein